MRFPPRPNDLKRELMESVRRKRARGKGGSRETKRAREKGKVGDKEAVNDQALGGRASRTRKTKMRAGEAELTSASWKPSAGRE